MLQHKKTKIASLIYAITLIAIFIYQASSVPAISVGSSQPTVPALSMGGSLINRLLYHHFHANVLHLALNLYAFLSLVFIANTSPRKILLAFIIASSVPAVFVGGPTIGLSATIYALFGLTINNLKAHSIILFSIFFPILVTFFYPLPIANTLHLYSYLVGVLIASSAHRFHQRSS